MLFLIQPTLHSETLHNNKHFLGIAMRSTVSDIVANLFVENN